MKRTQSWLQAAELVICISEYMLLLVWDVIRLAALCRVRRRDEWHFRLMLFPALRVLINLYVVLLRRISFQSKRRLLRLVKWGVILPGQSVCVWWLGSVRSVKMDRKISGGLYTVFPRIIAPFDGNVLNNRLNPPLLLLSPSSLPFILSLSSWGAMWSRQQNWLVTIQTLGSSYEN